MSHVNIFILGLSIMLLTGCNLGQQTEQLYKQLLKPSDNLPEWVRSPQCASDMLCAVGSGVNPTMAKKAAYPALAAQISIEVDDKHILKYVSQGAFVRETENRWTETTVSDINLDGAAVTKEARSNNTSYVQIDLPKQNLKTSLLQQIRDNQLTLEEEVKRSSGKGFDEWWRLQNMLSTVKVITRNQNILEQQFGIAPKAETNALIEHYYQVLYSSFNSRELALVDETNHINKRKLKDAVNKQLKQHDIVQVEKSFFGRPSSIELSTHFKSDRIGQETFVNGELIVQLKNSQNQPLAQTKFCAKTVTLESTKVGLKFVGKKLERQLTNKTNLFNDLINQSQQKGRNKCAS